MFDFRFPISESNNENGRFQKIHAMTRSLPTTTMVVAAAWWVLLTHSPADAFIPESITIRSIRLSATTPTPTPTGPVVGGNDQSDASPFESFSSLSSPSSTVLLDETIIGDIDEVLDMPWSDVQTWALTDNLPKFTVFIPSTTSIGSGDVDKKKPSRFAMWRTITREIPELAGYPVPFLRKMHQRILKRQQQRQQSRGSSGDGENEEKYETPGVLPMVDNFEFTYNGGIIGRAYGLPGIVDGTIIETPSLVSPERTVPLGYVTTEGEDENGNKLVGFSYELGICATTTPMSSSSSYYSLDGTERSVAAAAAARRLVSEGGVRTGAAALGDVTNKMAVAGSGVFTDNDANQDLVYLTGATAMLLASATAVGMLSHHLTVNVFWV